MKTLAIVAIAIVIAFAASHRASEAQEARPGTTLLAAYSFIDNERPADGGRSLAEYCQSLLNLIPRLKPDEERWLTAEMSAIGPRMLKAMESAEYAQRRMIDWAGVCNIYARELAVEPQRKAQWLRLAMHLTEPDIELYMRRTMSQMRTSPVQEDELTFRAAVSRAILNKIIMPAVVAADSK